MYKDLLQRFIYARAQQLLCFLNLLFGEVLIAGVIVVAWLRNM